MKKVISYILFGLSCFLYSNALASPELTQKRIKTISNGLYSYFYDEHFDRLNISLKDLNETINALVKQNANLMPNAVVFGVIGRCQYIVGACYGIQHNITMDNDNEAYISTYQLLSVELGLAAMVQADIYVALCYGSCSGSEAEGYFVGSDLTVNFLLGTMLFTEVGVDFLDEIDKAIFYVGAGFGVGAGGGWSLGMTNYKLINSSYIKLK